MVANGTTGRKAPSAAKKPAKSDSGIFLDSLFDDLKTDGTIELVEDVKKKLPVVKNPGNWNSEINGVLKSKDAVVTARAINRVPPSLARAFPNGRPLSDRPAILKCIHCKRAVSKHAMPKHIEGCLNKKQEKQRKKKEAKDARDAAARKERQGDSDDEDDDNNTKKPAVKTGLTASKKRKAADEGDGDGPGGVGAASGPPKKKNKKKEDAKSKAARPKAPVDVEKQCGVELPQGGQCARSLTCKSHSMGAKRAVPGRSAPYDKLLMEYQRKNQAKLQKAAFDANAPNPDDDSLPSGPVDSEEERDAVIASIARAWGGRPVYQPVPVPLRRKYEFNRMKGMMQSAFGTRGGGNLFGSATGGNASGGGFFGAAAAGSGMTTDAEGMIHARRGSVVPAARNMMAAPSRKPSVASAVGA